MITIKGRHIRTAMVERRRMKSRRFLPAEDCRPAPANPGDQVWTVSAITILFVRHSGAERSEEPGIHIPGAGVMDSGLAAVAAIRNDGGSAVIPGLMLGTHV